MIKADQYYKENLKEILINGDYDENPRPKYKDGELAHTKFITQVFEEYDISKGEFPITTLRNTAIKTGIKEILWIYQKQSNNMKDAHDLDIFWWDEWMNQNGNIGKAYSYNIESHKQNDVKRCVVKIKPIIVDEKYGELKNINKIPIEKSIDNLIYKTKVEKYGDYIIIDEFVKNNRSYIICQFLNTGYKYTIRKDSKKKGQGPKNNYIRTNIGVGYLDYTDDLLFSKSEKYKLHKIWSGMIRRCGQKKYYTTYENIFVHQDWHSFRNFLKDVKYLPQYFLARENDFDGWELDKDYYGSNCYSKNTCVFLKKNENVLYRSTQIPLIQIKDLDNNEIYYELSYTSLANTLGLSKGYTKIIVSKGKYKNLLFELIYDNNFLYRYEISKNQVNELLLNLKKNPFGRRHIISLWNWANIDKKELVECAYETLWSVRKVKDEFYLDLTLIQRSNDYIMAGYINKIQYVALQMMIASHLNYKVGKFCHLTQNLHVYDRHMDALSELLDREPLNQQPILKLKENKNFYDFTIDDFIIENINGIEKIKSPLEIAI